VYRSAEGFSKAQLRGYRCVECGEVVDGKESRGLRLCASCLAARKRTGEKQFELFNMSF
jgi:hypothetical protein